MNGTVSSVVVLKKYGFITGDNGQEYFFHESDMDSSWDELAYDWSNRKSSDKKKFQASFEPAKTPKGPRARSVRIVEE